MDHTASLRSEITDYRFLVELDDRLRSLIGPDAIALAAAEFLGKYLNVNRCAYANMEADQVTFNLTGNYTNSVPSIIGRYDCAAFGSEFLRLCHNGLPYVVQDSETDERTASVKDIYRQTQIRAVVFVPIIKDGKFVAGMAVHQTTPRQWQAAEIRLLGMVANRCWESIERNRITRELRESEAKFRTITNAMPQMVWTAQSDGIVDYHNERLAEFVGWSQDGSLGDAWGILLHPDDQELAAETWSHSVATGSSYEITYRLRHHSGEYRWTLARAHPVKNESGEIVKWMGTNTDIHVQKVAERVLQEENKRKDEFLAMLAHELRNPLAPISAAAELLSMTKSEDAHVQRTTAIIRRQVEHMTGLVDDLLDVSRVTRGIIQLENAFVDIKQVITDAVEQVRPQVEQHRHQLSMHVTAESIFVTGDYKRLVQVVSNLLDNAAKYTPVGGEISVGVETCANEVVLRVSDNGIGMQSDLLEDVFDLFHQGERASDRRQGGLGIGLALVKSLVERHHGGVTVYSAGPNQGSEFVVRLPCALPVQEVPGATLPALGNEQTNLRVLVVDDNVDAAESIAMLLGVLGNEVITAYDPSTALERVQGEKFDVYILDIGLPGMDGYELVKRVRTMHGPQKAVFAALTGYGQERDKRKAIEVGFDHHFVKPVDIQSLKKVFKTIS